MNETTSRRTWLQTLLATLFSLLAFRTSRTAAAPQAAAFTHGGFQTVEPLSPDEGYQTTTIYEYDDKGELISRREHTERVATHRIRTYDAAGRLIMVQG